MAFSLYPGAQAQGRKKAQKIGKAQKTALNGALLLLAAGILALSAGMAAVPASAQEPEDFPPGALDASGAPESISLESSFGALQPLADLLRPLFVRLSVIIGGIFGLYVILIAVRVYYERKKLHILKDIRYDLDQLNVSRGVPASKQKAGKLHRLFFDRLFPWHAKKHYALQKSIRKKKYTEG